MDFTSLQGDKALITAFITALVGFVTAVLSIVRLVNDKEGKTTEYRQSWTDSLRKSLSELISNLNTLAGTLTRHASVLDEFNAAIDKKKSAESESSAIDKASSKVNGGYAVGPIEDGQSDNARKQGRRKEDEERTAQLASSVLEEEKHIREVRRDLYQSYAHTRLHFKPNDSEFNRIEQKFDVLMEMLNQLSKLNGHDKEAERLVLREKVHAGVSDITFYARDILKGVWENVKQGEAAYQWTKWLSLLGGFAMLVILLHLGSSLNLFSRKDEKMAIVGASAKSVEKAFVSHGETMEAVRMSESKCASQMSSQVVNFYAEKEKRPISAPAKPDANPKSSTDKLPCQKQ